MRCPLRFHHRHHHTTIGDGTDDKQGGKSPLRGIPVLLSVPTISSAGAVGRTTTMHGRQKRGSVVAIKTATSRPVLLLWASVSLSVAVLCTWSYSQSAWTLRSSSEIGSLSTSSSEIIVVDNSNSNDSSVPGKSAIPLVHIGLFRLCIYASQSSVICVTHAELDYDWLPPAWQVHITEQWDR